MRIIKYGSNYFIEIIALISISLSAVLVIAPRVAEACGACVPPPPAEGPAVNAASVTDHRVIVLRGRDRTVVWDQLRLAGSAPSLGWLFPVRDGASVRVTVGSAQFADSVDNATAPSVVPVYCTAVASNPPAFPVAVPARGFARDVAGNAVPLAAVRSVERIDGTDSANVFHWMERNNFFARVGSGPPPPSADAGASEDSGSPTDDAAGPNAPDADAGAPGGTRPPNPLFEYAERHLDFIAVTFGPLEAGGAIPPVRIEIPGFAAELPLRGIAVGAADEVGVTIIVLAADRVSVAGFPGTELAAADFPAGTSPLQAYQQAFANARSRVGQAVWVTESASPLDWNVVGANVSDAQVDRELVSGTLGAGMPVFATRVRAILPLPYLLRDLRFDSASLGVTRSTYRYNASPGAPLDAFGQCARLRGGNFTGDARGFGRGPDIGCNCRTQHERPTRARGGWALAIGVVVLSRSARRRRRVTS